MPKHRVTLEGCTDRSCVYFGLQRAVCHDCDFRTYWIYNLVAYVMRMGQTHAANPQRRPEAAAEDWQCQHR